MHNAPAVNYPVGRSFFHGWLVVAAGLLGGLVMVLWLASTADPGWRQWLLAAVLVATVLSAANAWRRSPQGMLHWNGHLWEWVASGEALEGHLTVHLDFQSWMVLSVKSDRGEVLWLWPERRSEALNWDALRRAVFARVQSTHHQDASADPGRSRIKA